MRRVCARESSSIAVSSLCFNALDILRALTGESSRPTTCEILRGSTLEKERGNSCYGKRSLKKEVRVTIIYRRSSDGKDGWISGASNSTLSTGNGDGDRQPGLSLCNGGTLAFPLTPFGQPRTLAEISLLAPLWYVDQVVRQGVFDKLSDIR